MTHIAIPIMSVEWVLGCAASMTFIAATLTILKHVSRSAWPQAFRWIGTLLLCEVAATHMYLALIQQTWSLADSLPLHVCRLSVLVAAASLLVKRDRLYEWATYIGLPGGVYSILTPELTQGDAPWMLFDYYVTHSCLIIVPILLALSGWRPPKYAIAHTYCMVNLMALAVLPLNYMIDANYMYLARRPVASNPMIIGPWPWYILGLEVVLLIHLLVIDVVFRVRPWRRTVLAPAVNTVATVDHKTGVRQQET